MPVWLIWLIAAVGLAGAEALTGDLFLLMLSGGALAAVVSSLLVDNYVVDGVVFAVVALLLLVLVRPALRRRFAEGTGLPEPMKALEGKSALVLDRVGRHEGQVKLDGEVWTARPLNDNDVYEPGDHVTIMRIDGATAVVFKSI
jgi:membrane protein implicated in regulation of membrane protease activity